MDNEEVPLPTPSPEIQEFLSSGFFAQPSASTVSSQEASSYFTEESISPVSSDTLKGLQAIHDDMVKQQLPQEIQPVGSINTQPTFVETENLLKYASSLSTQQAVQGITDIKRKTDMLEQVRQTPERFGGSIEGGAESGSNSVVNNTTNITQIVPDYLLGIFQKYGRAPIWRDNAG